MTNEASVLQRLMQVIEDRKANPSSRSYTAQLLASGVDGIGAKVLEEASEVVVAAREEGAAGREHLVHEAADLVYHLFVLLGYRDVELKEIESELACRFGTSGLDEKASRLERNDGDKS